MNDMTVFSEVMDDWFKSIERISDTIFLARSNEHLVVINQLQPYIILDSVAYGGYPDSMHVYLDDEQATVVFFENLIQNGGNFKRKVNVL